MAPCRLPFGLLASTLLFFLPIVKGGSSTLPSVKPVGVPVPSDSTAGASRFKSETIQLTENAVKRIQDTEAIAEYAHLFAFDNGKQKSFSAASDDGETCKLLPGDDSWPSEFLWETFDLLLGRALVPIIPVASPCYKNSAYDNYDATKCATIVANWTTSELQYAFPLILK